MRESTIRVFGMRLLLLAALASLLVPSSPAFAKGSPTSANATDSGGLTVTRDASGDSLSMSRSRPRGTKPSSVKSGTWTILVYMCGSDLESGSNGSMGGAATKDINEMYAAYKDGGNVNYIIATGGAQQWSIEGIDTSRIQFFEMQESGLTCVANYRHTGDVPNMGDPNALATFVSWGATNYPADKIGLILWDHGGGPLGGVCYDELADDHLTLNELDEALDAANEKLWAKLEFIGFDACLMSSFETANYLASYANYQISSEDTEPFTGWDYNLMSEYLSKNKKATGADLGVMLLDEYYDSMEENYDSQTESTLSIVDLSKMDELNEALDDFSQDLGRLTKKDTSYAAFVQAMDPYLMIGFTPGADETETRYNLVDLKALINAHRQIYRNDSSSERHLRVKRLADVLADVVVDSKNGLFRNDMCGLSVYFPVNMSKARGDGEVELYEDVCQTPRYLSFVKKAVKLAEGTATSDEYDDSITYDTEPYLTDKGLFTFTLDRHGRQFVNAVNGRVWREREVTNSETGETEKRMVLYGQTYDVGEDEENGTYYDAFDGNWLALPDGQMLATQPRPDLVDKRYRNTCRAYQTLIEFKKSSWDKYYPMRLIIGQNIETKEAWIAETQYVSESGDATNVQKYDVEEGDCIKPKYQGYMLNDAEKEYTWSYGSEYVVEKGGLQPVYEGMPQGPYYYQFVITDVYGEPYYTRFAKFYVKDDGKITYDSDSLH